MQHTPGRENTLPWKRFQQNHNGNKGISVVHAVEINKVGPNFIKQLRNSS